MKSSDCLVILTPGFPENEKDFLCIPPLQDYLKSMMAIEACPEMVVIAFQYPYTPGKYNWHGIEVFSVGGENRRFPRKWFTWRRAKKYFHEIQLSRNVKAIHSLWLGECAWIGQALNRKYNIPHCSTAMGQDVLASNAYLKRLDLKNIKVAAVSERAGDALKENSGKSPDAVIPWGLDIPNNETGGSLQKEYDVLGVGSFIHLKAFDEFLEAILLLRKSRPDIRALLIGYGPERDNLLRMIHDNHLERNVSLQGLTPRSEIFSKMLQSRVLLHPSRYESYGMVFQEALAHGMAIVSRPVGIAREGARWKLGTTAEALAAGVDDFMTNGFSPEPVILKSAKETAEDYLKFFGFR